jgi:hypothetical protein
MEENVAVLCPLQESVAVQHPLQVMDIIALFL